MSSLTANKCYKDIIQLQRRIMEKNIHPPHPNFNRAFINQSIQKNLDFLETTLKGENNVINFKKPEDLHNAVDFVVKDEPCPEEQLLKVCQNMFEHQVKPYHPHFHNQLFGGFDQYSYIGAVMAPTINGSVYTY